jgi:hypothetical protein
MDEFQASGFPVTIVRPSSTYGDTMIPGAINSWEKPWSLIDRMRRGEPIRSGARWTKNGTRDAIG